MQGRKTATGSKNCIENRSHHHHVTIYVTIYDNGAAELMCRKLVAHLTALWAGPLVVLFTGDYPARRSGLERGFFCLENENRVRCW